MKRGRKTTGQEQAEVAATSAGLAVPDGMTTDEGAVWVRVVSSRPPGHFGPGDVDLLVAYCVAVGQHAAATAVLREKGLVVDVQISATYTKPIPNPYLSVQADQAALIAQLSVKLRLAPSSRIRADANAKAERDGKVGTDKKGKAPKAPWETK